MMALLDAGPEPSFWAQALLAGLVRPDRLEGVAGDLLEEYRESMLPSRGRRRANWWYVRQVSGFLLRLAWPVVAMGVAAGVVRDLADTFSPPAGWDHPYQFRSAVSTYVGITIPLLAGFYGAFRTGRIATGVIVALTGNILSHFINLAWMAVLYYSVISRDLPMLLRFQMTGGWDETLFFPGFLLLPVGLLSLIGGAAGRAFARFPIGRRPA
jgi:hypothetical protein